LLAVEDDYTTEAEVKGAGEESRGDSQRDEIPIAAVKALL
jgi:hypothetical protein